MDALDLLTADHNRVRGLFTRFRAAEDSAEKGRLGELVLTELTVHTAIEEERFYPWCRQLSDEIEDTVREGIQEHHVVKVLMEELPDLSADDPEWTAKMTVLIENVEHHAQEEEEELFADIRKLTSAEDREQMGQQLEEAKASKGAPVLADTIDLTTAELKKLATEQEIPGRSTMSHDELAATVSPTS